MKIRVLAVGKMQEAWLREAQQEYLKRISRFAEIEICEVAEAADHLPLKKQLQTEAERILKQLEAQDFVIALDLAGRKMDSPGLAANLQRWLEEGGAKIHFVIGGSNGFHDSFLQRANFRMSMGEMTFPHQLARVMLLEQIFRAFKIQRGEKYHK